MLFAKSTKEAIKTSTSILYGDIPETKFAGTSYTWREFELKRHSQVSPPDAVPSEDVNYVFNSLGYRCPEFNTPRGDINVVSFGCSEVAGIGVALSSRFSAVFCRKLAEQTGKSVVDWNLGVPAKSNDFISRCAPSAIEKLRPDIILACFTYASRREFIDFDGKVYDFLDGIPIKTIPAHMLDVWNCLIRLNNRHSNLMNLSRSMAIVNQAAKLSGAKWLYSFVADESVNSVKTKDFVGHFDHIDYTTDGVHAGPLSHRNLGEKFFNAIHPS